MDATILMIAFIAFFALVAAWLVLPASPVTSTATAPMTAPRRSAAQA